VDGLRGGIVDYDGTQVITSGLPVTVTIPGGTPECVKGTASFYDEWLGQSGTLGTGAGWDKPDCWCYMRQCSADADGLKPGLYYVDNDDLAIFVAAFSKGDKKLDNTKICADFDHNKPGLYRVDNDDLAIFVANFSKGDLKVKPCDNNQDGVLEVDDDYNFWTTP
jgi:hypothetical protein